MGLSTHKTYHETFENIFGIRLVYRIIVLCMQAVSELVPFAKTEVLQLIDDKEQG